MSLYRRYVLPHLLNAACGARPIAKQREKIVPQASGVVLEIGFGSGLNLPYYDPKRVSALIVAEPEPGIRGLGERAARTSPLSVQMLPDPAERLSLGDASVDCVLCTYTLCTVDDPRSALAEARRVLKPGGRFLFCEHGLSPDPEVARTQRAIEPFWKPLAGGCHLTRDPLALMRAAGFTVADPTTMYLPGTPRFGGYNSWGTAVPV